MVQPSEENNLEKAGDLSAADSLEDNYSQEKTVFSTKGVLRVSDGPMELREAWDLNSLKYLAKKLF